MNCSNVHDGECIANAARYISSTHILFTYICMYVYILLLLWLFPFPFSAHSFTHNSQLTTASNSRLRLTANCLSLTLLLLLLLDGRKQLGLWHYTWHLRSRLCRPTASTNIKHRHRQQHPNQRHCLPQHHEAMHSQRVPLSLISRTNCLRSLSFTRTNSLGGWAVAHTPPLITASSPSRFLAGSHNSQLPL